MDKRAVEDNRVRRVLDGSLPGVRGADFERRVLSAARSGARERGARKLPVALAFALMLTLAAVTALAVTQWESIWMTVTGRGEKTAGVTLSVQDVYYDGYQLLLSVAMEPNEEGYYIYNDVLGDYEVTEDRDGLKPLGVYCESYARETGEERWNDPPRGAGHADGAGYVRTDSYRFLPGDMHGDIEVSIVYGVMETPGHPVGGEMAMETMRIDVPLVERAETTSVKVVDEESLLPGVEEVFVAQTDEVAGVYIFSRGDHSIGFETEDDLGSVSSDARPLEDERSYIYQAMRKNGPLETVRVIDYSNKGQVFEIDLRDGTVRRAEDAGTMPLIGDDGNTAKYNMQDGPTVRMK